MTSIGLNTGLKALLAAQAALETTGHNISNSSTPGYSRQRLQVSASAALMVNGTLIGSGISADLVTRSADALLLVRTTKQISSLNRLDSALGSMTEIESLLGEPGSFGLSAGLNEFFSSVSALSTSTEDLVYRTGMVQTATAMTTQFNQLSATMSTIGRDTSNQVQIQAKQEQLLRDLSGYIDVQHHEDDQGVVRITTGGRLLVGGTQSFDMRSAVDGSGAVRVFLEGSGVPVKLTGGSIAGLAKVSEQFIPELQGKLDTLAKNLIFEMNRVHSTGTPDQGSFTSLTSSYGVRDSDLDGLVRDELISQAGLPFDIQKGELYVNVSHVQSGEFTSDKLSIDPGTTTVGDFLDQLNAIDGLNATINNFNRVQIFADAGFGFDFAPRLDTSPDKFGTLGSARASLGAGQKGPYSLADGDTLDLAGPVGPFSVTCNAADVGEMSEATAQELADVLNANPDMQANGLRAVVTNDRLYLQTAATGDTANFTVSGGSSLAGLGLSAGTIVTGSNTSVDIKIGGAYSGQDNNEFLFVPKTDGVIGTTPGLEVDVFNEGGQLVATLDLGATYQPGTVIEIADGITASFSFGSISATSNDRASVNLVKDGDTSDVLAAFGINSLFVGTGAADIDLRSELVSDPSLISTGTSGATGDNRTLLAMLDLQTQGLEALSNDSLGDFYGDAVSDVGFEISQASATREVEVFLLQNLETRREERSGVNVDEELVDMVRFEENFNAASRYIQVLNELTDEILNLI